MSLTERNNNFLKLKALSQKFCERDYFDENQEAD